MLSGTVRTWCSVAILGAILWLVTRGIAFPNECEMTYMNGPRLHPIRIVGKERSTFKYSLFRYVQAEVRQDPQKPTGAPVLFLPGHLGSAKQARSLGSHAAHQVFSNVELHDATRRDLDVYTVDFNEEWTGISGHHLQDQAEFVNSAVRSILALYSVDNYAATTKAGGPNTKTGPWKKPSHVIVVGHSMAGIVARAAVTLGNHRPGTIRTMFTLSTPHQNPPFPLDQTMDNFYTHTNSVWREATTYTQREEQYEQQVIERKRKQKKLEETARIEADAAAAMAEVQAAEEAAAARLDESDANVDGDRESGTTNSPPKTTPEPASEPVKVKQLPMVKKPSYKHPKKLLQTVEAINVVSVAGGFQDQTILAKKTRLDGLVNLERRGVQYLSSDLDGGVSADHLAILWCAQVTHVITKSILALTDPSTGWISSKQHATVVNETLRPSSLPLDHPLGLYADDNTLFDVEYAKSRPLISRLGFIVQHFVYEHGFSAIAFWLAIFCCILAQFFKPATGASLPRQLPPRRELSLAIWPDHHNPLLMHRITDGRGAIGGAVRLVRRIGRGLISTLAVLTLAAEYVLPFFAPDWLVATCATPAAVLTKLGVGRLVVVYLLAAGAASITLHALDSLLHAAGLLLGWIGRLTPTALHRLAGRCGAAWGRHAFKIAISGFVTLWLVAHTLDRAGNEALAVNFRIRWPSVALEVAVFHGFMLLLTFVGLLRLFLLVLRHSVATTARTGPMTRAAEYQRLVLWGYICLVPIALFQGIATGEVLTRAPAALVDYSWGAFFYAMTLIPVAAHLHIAASYPVVAAAYSPDSSKAAEDAEEEAEVSAQADLEVESKQADAGVPDYATRLRKRQEAARRKARSRGYVQGCPNSPHEFGARWSEFVMDEDGADVRRHSFANGEVVFEGPLFRVARCNCAGHGLNPADWCSFCRCKTCGVDTWKEFNRSTGQTNAWDDLAVARRSVREAVDVVWLLELLALVVVLFATGPVYRVHSFAGCVGALAIFEHMQRNPKLRQTYSSN